VVEIERSPAGPSTGAFFDFDGTLIAGFSAGVFAGDRFRRREVGLGEMARMLRLSVETSVGAAGFPDLMRLSATSVRGRREDDLVEIGERLSRQKLAARVYPGARELVAAHKRRGHTVALVSSATRHQIEPIARDLGIEHIICNEFEVEDGVLTGEISEPIVWGETKAEIAQEFGLDRGIDMARSYFYADGDEDVALMHLVGHPRPTNPRPALARMARKRGWPIVKFELPKRPRGIDPVPIARNLLGAASFAPAAAGGLAVGLLRRNRRAGVNVMSKAWVDATFAATGVKVNAEGVEHLWSHRPAVFIFNHRNLFDVFIVAKLIERDYTAVGKKELASNPFAAGMAKLMDAVFIDREDAQAAIAAMEPVKDAVRKGLSLMISPEGTRSESGTVAPFKKGPFRIAMAGGVPVVPIVIRNADDIAGRNGMLLRSGTVDVRVLPPVPTDNWTVEDLDDRIAAVRQSFVETLSSWQQGGRDVDRP
jgi:putative phosphoserine phosphatase/1-acylglycerol-3-phosphate O-acyltransferase